MSAVLSDVDDGLVNQGMRVTCTIDAYPDLEIEGRVVSIAPFAQELRWGSLAGGWRSPSTSIDSFGRAARTRDVGAGRGPRGDATTMYFSSHGQPSKRAATARRAAPPAVGRPSIGPCDALDCVLLAGLGAGTRLCAVLDSDP